MTDVRRIVSEHRRAIWLLTAAVVVNVALYAAVVAPLSARVEAEQQLAADATRSVNAARRAHQAAQATVAGKQQAEEELATFYRDVLPADISGARRVFYPRLQQLAAGSNLTMRSTTNPDSERRGELRKLTTTMALTGEYTNIRHFIHELETAPEFLVLESVNVTQPQEGRDLNVTAQVATYYRTGGDGN